MPRPKDTGKGKGKGRADERTPLLADADAEQASSSSSLPSLSRSPRPRPRLLWRNPHRPAPSRTLSLLLTASLALLSLSFLAILFLLLLGYSYAYPSSTASPGDLLAHAVALRGPDDVQVLNLTSSGLWVRLDGHVGVDADWLLGFRSPDEHVQWWERCRRALGRWGVDKVRAVDVHLGTIDLAASASGETIARLVIPPLVVPLTPALRALDEDALSAGGWLSPITVDVLVQPSEDVAALAAFARESWMRGRIDLRARVGSVSVSPVGFGVGFGAGNGGAGAKGGWIGGWRRKIAITREDLETDIRLKIPSLPGFPRPGTPLSEFLAHISLDSYAIRPVRDARSPGGGDGEGEGKTKELRIEGSASLPFPLLPSFPPLRPFEFPLSVPFLISLLPDVPPPAGPNNTSVDPPAPTPTSAPAPALDPLPIAAVHTSPLLIPPPSHNLSISISGILLPPPPTSPLLSAFISAYLAGRPYPILLTSPPPHPAAQIPPFLSPFLASLHIPYSFPGANPRPRLIDSIQISNMRILPSTRANEFLVSGEILASVSLPRAFAALAFNASAVQPNVLIYDGPPLANDANAFARLDSPVLPVTQSANLSLCAPLDEVPVLLLPGREPLFRAFVQKVIFSKAGAWAGVKGESAVWAGIGGLGEVGVRGVHVEGGSRVGGRGKGAEGEGEIHAWMRMWERRVEEEGWGMCWERGGRC